MPTNNNQCHRNHYVPQWYQSLFLPPGTTRFHYLDLNPDTLVSPGGVKYQRRELRRLGPKSCFCQDDLYTVKLGGWSTDEIERRFFGPIDLEGKAAVEFFTNYELRDGVHEAFQNLVRFMDAQRFRTPRGLDWLMSLVRVPNHNLVLQMMQRVFQYHATMWHEGIWEIVSAEQSSVKFLLTDEPVTFYNAKAFPASRDCRYPDDVGLHEVGTRTIFPLGSDKCLIITHLQLIRITAGARNMADWGWIRRGGSKSLSKRTPASSAWWQTSVWII